MVSHWTAIPALPSSRGPNHSCSEVRPPRAHASCSTMLVVTCFTDQAYSQSPTLLWLPNFRNSPPICLVTQQTKHLTKCLWVFSSLLCRPPVNPPCSVPGTPLHPDLGVLVLSSTHSVTTIKTSLHLVQFPPSELCITVRKLFTQYPNSIPDQLNQNLGVPRGPQCATKVESSASLPPPSTVVQTVHLEGFQEGASSKAHTLAGAVQST